jgi:pSer/pThr/pTyr-binding forkhead associated (FHA) protein
MADAHGGPFISVVENNRETHRRPIDKPLVIGRANDCDLALEEPILSRHHCRLEPSREGDGWAVVDLNSRNGTFVNAVRVKMRQGLRHRDIITVGRAHITFHAHGYIPPRQAPTPMPRDPNSETITMSDSMIGRALPFTRPAPKPQPRSDE